jgi:hypothetical protein
MKRSISILLTAMFILFLTILAVGQAVNPPPEQMPVPLNESGQIAVHGHPTPYLIRHLPVSSFPELPEPVAADLNRRGCLIPQTYEAHRPENVIHASLERAGSSDWAVLCSAQGKVMLLIFFASGPDSGAAWPLNFSTVAETTRLQPHGANGELGFNWGIDRATPQQVHDAEAAMPLRPARLDHDALADSVVDGRVVYRFYSNRVWTQVYRTE